MSVSLVQGDVFRRANGSMNATQQPKSDDLVAEFNKAVTAYSTAHQQYVTALLEGKASKSQLQALEKTANMKYEDVITTGTKVTQQTKLVIKNDNNAEYGKQLRDLEHDLTGVLSTLAAEQAKLGSQTSGESTLDGAIMEAKLRASAEQTRTTLWMIACVLLLVLIMSYLL